MTEVCFYVKVFSPVGFHGFIESLNYLERLLMEVMGILCFFFCHSEMPYYSYFYGYKHRDVVKRREASRWPAGRRLQRSITITYSFCF